MESLKHETASQGGQYKQQINYLSEELRRKDQQLAQHSEDGIMRLQEELAMVRLEVRVSRSSSN